MKFADDGPSHRQAVLLILGAALLWSLGGVLIQSVDAHPLLIAGVRSLLAAGLLLALLRRPRFTASPWLWAGAVAYALTVTLFVWANKETSAANAIVLQYTAPVWVALFGASFLGERATRADALTLVVALAGMALCFQEGLTAGRWLGDALALASGVAYAWLALLLRKQKDGPRHETIIAGNLLTAAVAGALLPFTPGALDRLPDAAGWTALAALGLFQLGLSYHLYAHALRRVTALEASVLPVLEPVLNPLWVLLFLGQGIRPLTLVGAALVLGAVTVRAVWSTRRP